MRPCRNFVYSDIWLIGHADDIVPTADDEEFYSFINSNYDVIEEILEISTAVVYNGFNQSFIDLAKPLYSGALEHCEYFISPGVKKYYCRKFEPKDADRVIIMSMAYFLSTWFDRDSVRNAMVYGYRTLSPGVLLRSEKKRGLFEKGVYDKDINSYIKRNNIPIDLYKRFVDKLKFHGVANYLGAITPFDHLSYDHVIDVFVKYLYVDMKRATQLAVLYFPLDVIETVLKL